MRRKSCISPEEGVYSIDGVDSGDFQLGESVGASNAIVHNTARDQKGTSLFERLTPIEMNVMFDREGKRLVVKPWLRGSIVWRRGDATDPELVAALGQHDVVVANRFLCHMEPAMAERCLRNLARLVRPGGYLFVSGVDLDVRAKTAQELKFDLVHWHGKGYRRGRLEPA